MMFSYFSWGILLFIGGLVWFWGSLSIMKSLKTQSEKMMSSEKLKKFTKW